MIVVISIVAINVNIKMMVNTQIILIIMKINDIMITIIGVEVVQLKEHHQELPAEVTLVVAAVVVTAAPILIQ
jgi:hypothetical protein